MSDGNRYAGLRWRLGRRGGEEVDEEFQHHLEMRIQEYVAAGMTLQQARDEAHRRLGDLKRYVRETKMIDAGMAQERRRRELVGTAARELKHSARTLVRSPLFAGVAVLTLALGLGATGAIYTLLNAVVLRPLSYPSSAELVYVESHVSGGGAAGAWGVSPAGYFTYRDNNRTMSSVGHYYTFATSISGDGDAERVSAGFVSASLFEVLGGRALHGRLISADDDRPGAGRVVVLSHPLWERRYGSDPSVVGRSIMVDASPAEVIGVLPPGFALPSSSPDIWMAARLNPAGPFYNEHYLAVVGRLRDGENVESVQRDLAALTARFPEIYTQAYSESFMREYGFAVQVMTLRSKVLGNTERTLWILFAAVGLVLMIACANVANLFLVRAEARRRDGAVRSALGAERGQLAFHYITESTLLTVMAAAAGLGLGAGALSLLRKLAPTAVPRLGEVQMSASTVVLLLTLAVVLGVLFGMFALFRVSRDSSEVLRESGRGSSASRRQNFIRGALATTQVALALTLLSGAGLLFRSFLRLRAVDPGYETTNVLTAAMALPYARYNTYEAANTFYRDLVQGIESLPGVERAAVSSVLPTQGGACSLVFVEGQPVQPGAQAPCITYALVSPGYFDVLSANMQGQAPTWNDNDARAGRVVITQSLADRFWKDRSAVGAGLNSGGDAPPYWRIAGVTEPMHLLGLDQPPTEVVYYPLLPMEGASLWGPPRNAYLLVRTRGARPAAIVPDVRRILNDLDRDVPLANIRSLEDVLNASMARRTFAMMLLATAAVMALVLSAVGIYGVISYIVDQRRSEIGIRMALGARTAEVSRMVVGQSLRLTAAGVIIGIVLSMLTTRTLQSMLFEVDAADPLTFAAVTTLVVALVLLAAWMPARRASRVSPTEVMRV